MIVAINSYGLQSARDITEKHQEPAGQGVLEEAEWERKDRKLDVIDVLGLARRHQFFLAIELDRTVPYRALRGGSRRENPLANWLHAQDTGEQSYQLVLPVGRFSGAGYHRRI